MLLHSGKRGRAQISEARCVLVAGRAMLSMDKGLSVFKKSFMKWAGYRFGLRCNYILTHPPCAILTQ